MSAYNIRLYGDPVLKQVAAPILDIDGTVKALADAMIESMYEVHGLGLAAPQVGVQKRLFVYDLYDGEGPRTVINPTLSGFDGEWTYDEGCLSLPGLYFPITRPKVVHLTGYDVNGDEVSVEADEVLARAFQHELDHLNGTLLLEHLDRDQRKAALKELRQRATA
ncbi:MAG TPA: peptide deformylase [Acidimicrobiales bacterium]|nr:peptide deformylase [Acidimicrobiales bacterium]